jgi:hypothetical protein
MENVVNVALYSFIHQIYISHLNLLLRLSQLDLALRIVDNLSNLDTTQMVLARNARVVVEQVPLSLELSDRVVSRPALDRLQDAILVSERTKRRVANGVRQVVGVAGRVREVVLAVVLVHPGGLEEAPVVVAGVDRLAIGVVDDKILHVAGESVHVVTQLRHPGHQSRLVAGGFHVGVGVTVKFATSPALQLATPDAAEVEVGLTVIVNKAGGVDAVASRDVALVGLEGTFGLVGDGHANPEDAFLVPGRVVEVEFAVLLGGVGSPELFVYPWDVLGFECDTVVGDGTFDAGHGEDVVVGHVVLVAIVVVLDIGLTVVGRVDVELAVKDVSAWVGCEEVGHDGTGVFLRWVGHGCRCDGEVENGFRVSARDLHGSSDSGWVLYLHEHL